MRDEPIAGQHVEITFHAEVVNAGGVNVYGIVNAPSVAPPVDREQAAAWLFGRPAPVGDSLSAWLDPRAGVLKLHERPETDELVRWCVGGPAAMTRLVCAPGGQGKTVLAEQVCQRLRGKGWLAGLVALPPLNWRADEPAALTRPVPHLQAWSLTLAAAGRANTLAGVEGVLLVVDYADHNPDVAAALLDALAGTDHRDTPVRLLLLARGTGRWWTSLVARHGRGLVDPAVCRLPALHHSLVATPPGSPISARPLTVRLWQEAAEAFTAKAIKENMLPHGHQVTAETASGLTPEFPEFLTTLDLYAHALVRVLDLTAGGVTGETAEWAGPIEHLLAHEYRQLESALAAAAPGTDPMRVLDVVCLRPANRGKEAARALAALPGLAGLAATAPLVLDALVRALASMYPAESSTRVWGAPKPDRLADVHLLATATHALTDDDWADYLISIVTDEAGTDGEGTYGVAAHVVAVVVRALSAPECEARYQLGARRLRHGLHALLRAAPRDALPALLAADHEEQFTAATTQVIDDAVTGLDVVRAVDALLAGFPVPRQRQLGVRVSRRLVVAGPDSDPSGPCGYLQTLINHSRRLAEAGHHDAAMAAAQDAMGFLPRIPADDGNVMAVALRASALTNLGSRLIEHRRTEEALSPLTEAVALRRGLSDLDPDRYLPDLAAALTNQIACLLDLGRADQAANAAQHAIDALDAPGSLVVSSSWNTYRLALAWGTLADAQRAAGRSGQAAQAAGRALEMMTTLNQRQPFVFRASLAAAQLRLAVCLALTTATGSGMPRKAVTLAQLAVDAFRELSRVDSAAYSLDLSRAWQTLAICQSRQPTRGLGAVGEALAILQRLGNDALDVERAYCLSTQSLLHAAAGNSTAAIKGAHAALTLFQNAATGLNLSRDIAAAHGNLAYALHIAARHEEAVAAAQYAVDLHRDSDATALEAADALVNLALCLAADGQITRATSAQTEAVGFYLTASADHPLAFARLRHAQTDLDRLGNRARVASRPPRLKGRFRRHWPLTPVRHLLPGVSSGFWATDLASRDTRTHRVREELLAWFDRTPRRVAPAPTATTPAATVATTTAASAVPAAVPAATASLPLRLAALTNAPLRLATAAQTAPLTEVTGIGAFVRGAGAVILAVASLFLLSNSQQGQATAGAPDAAPSSPAVVVTPNPTEIPIVSPEPATTQGPGQKAPEGGATPTSSQPPPERPTPTTSPTKPPVDGPPEHGQLIDTLAPDYLYSGRTQMVINGVWRQTPETVIFDAPAKSGPPPRSVVPYVNVPDGNPHTYRFALHVHISGSSPVEFRFTSHTGQLRASRTVPAGDATLWFTDTVDLDHTGWMRWQIYNANRVEWQLTAVDFYEVTDTGPAPIAAPKSHPSPGAPAAPSLARFDMGHIRTANSALAIDQAYQSTALVADFNPLYRPSPAQQGVRLSYRVPDRGGPFDLRMACKLRNEAAAARYRMDTQIVPVPAGQSVVLFNLGPQSPGWHTWLLTELNGAVWVFENCDMYQNG